MSSFALAGDVGVRVTGAAASRLVRRWVSEAATASAVTDLEVRDATRAIDAPARARDAFFGDIDVWTERDTHVLVANGARALVRGALVETEGDRDPPPWLGLLALSLALRTRDVFHLHAGGVVLNDGPILVVGGSGAGKTTTTLALLAATPGARSLGDDTLFLERSGAILATGRPFHVTEATLAMFPALADRIIGVVDEATHKHVVRMASPATTNAAMPRACVFPTVTRDAETTASRLSDAETLALLMAQSALLALPGVPARNEHLALLARIADRAPGIALRLGDDARSDPTRVARVVLESIARCG